MGITDKTKRTETVWLGWEQKGLMQRFETVDSLSVCRWTSQVLTRSSSSQLNNFEILTQTHRFFGQDCRACRGARVGTWIHARNLTIHSRRGNLAMTQFVWQPWRRTACYALENFVRLLSTLEFEKDSSRSFRLKLWYCLLQTGLLLLVLVAENKWRQRMTAWPPQCRSKRWNRWVSELSWY